MDNNGCTSDKGHMNVEQKQDGGQAGCHNVRC